MIVLIIIYSFKYEWLLNIMCLGFTQALMPKTEFHLIKTETCFYLDFQL